MRLAPPVNWNQNPYRSEAWRSKLNSFGWISPLLASYSRSRNIPALRQATALMLSWIRANPPFAGFGWADKISGERAGELAYLTAAAQCRGILTPSQRAALVRSATDHGRFLADPDNYRGGNHGLFQDEGLLQLTGYLPSLPDAARWRDLASKRFVNGLPLGPEAVDLEHSPSYHFLVINLVERVLRLPGQRTQQVLDVLRRMRAVAGWFVMPDGSVTRLGDSGYETASIGIRRAAASYRGIAPTVKSGFGIVKAGGSYLSVAAGYHSKIHKQADELTFELYDRGRHIVTDTGRYTAARDQSDPAKVRALNFTKSSQAHSGLVVDDVSYPVRQYQPYGSAIVATGAGAGWYAIEGRNPLVERQGVQHRRLFLYKPGSALVVVDRVTASGLHTYTRFFQLQPGIAVRRQGALLRLSAPRFSGTLYNAGTTANTRSAIVTGRRRPLPGFTRSPLLGFTSSPNKFVPFLARTSIVFRSRGRSASYVTVIGLGGNASAALVRSAPEAVSVRVKLANRPTVEVTAVRNGEAIAVSATPTR